MVTMIYRHSHHGVVFWWETRLMVHLLAIDYFFESYLQEKPIASAAASFNFMSISQDFSACLKNQTSLLLFRYALRWMGSYFFDSGWGIVPSLLMQWNKKGDAMETCHLHLEKWKESEPVHLPHSPTSVQQVVLMPGDSPQWSVWSGVEKSPLKWLLICQFLSHAPLIQGSTMLWIEWTGRRSLPIPHHVIISFSGLS